MIAASGPVSLSTIQGEFGGANPISMNEYYRDGAYVKSTDSGVSGVAQSGSINMGAFRGSAKVTGHSVSLNKTGVSGSCTNSSASCTATTDSITATVTGGVGPFTVTHVLVSGTAITPNTNTSLTTTHSKSCPPSTPYFAVYLVRVTDTGNGNLTADSPTYTVDVENLG